MTYLTKITDDNRIMSPNFNRLYLSDKFNIHYNSCNFEVKRYTTGE